MTTLLFPQNPTVGQVYNAPNGVTYTFTGTKWTGEDNSQVITVTGPQGATGAPGAPGVSNTPGPAGATGSTGPQGLRGYQGDRGDIGSTGPKGDPGLGSTQAIILNAVAGPTPVVTGVDVTQWSASYTGTGGQVLVRADITAWTTAVGQKNWYLKKNGTVVATGNFYFNAGSTHMALPPLQYIDTTGAGTNIWSIAVGTGLNADQMDSATITVTETVGMSNTTITKAAAFVDAGTFVTLDNLKCTVTTGGSRGLSCATVSGTMASMISGTFGYINGVGGSAASYIWNITTTPSGSCFNWSFPNAGDGSTYLIEDTNSQRFYRVTLMIGPGYTKNFISIERLL